MKENFSFYKRGGKVMSQRIILPIENYIEGAVTFTI